MMKSPDYKTMQRVSQVIFGVGLVLLVSGCNQVQDTSASRANAPGLETPGFHGTPNTADPNAPFFVRASAPRLAVRESVLDISSVADCRPEQLSLFESQARANGDRHSLRLTIENTGAACRIGGFPAVSLLSQNGTVLGSVRVRRVSSDTLTASLAAPSAPGVLSTSVQGADKPSEPSSGETPSPIVLLLAKGDAAFQLGWTSGPTCIQASKVAVSAPYVTPGPAHAVILTRQLSVCKNELLLTAIRAEGTD